MNSRAAALALALLAAGLAAAGCASGPENGENDAAPRTTRELKASVRNAARLVERQGEAAFAAFDAPSGPWRRGDESLFVIDASGTFVYHGFDATLLGTNASDLADEDGRPYGKRWAEIAAGKPATGWAFHERTRPESRRPEWTATHLAHARTPSGAVLTVGSGVHGLEPDRELLVDLVEDAVAALDRGGNTALLAIDDPKGPFVYRDVAVFVMEMDGVLRANALFPELVGQSIFEFRGPDGKSPADEHIRVAKTRGYGFCEYAWHHPDGAPGRKLAYVRRVSFEGRPVVVGASLYLDPRPESVPEEARPAPPASGRG